MWRKFRKKTKRIFPSCFDEHTIFLFRAHPYSSDVIFFPPFHREVLRLPYRSSGSLGSSIRVYVFVSTFRVRTRERKKSERRQEGIITGTRPFAVDRDEESEASICLLRGVFHPFIGFVNFATGYVITGQAKPRKSVRGRKREREKGWKREKRETGVLKKSGQMEWYYCAIETSTVLKKFVLLRIPIND